MRKFDEILKSHPESPRALWGRGLVYDKQAEQQRSNELLEEGIALMDKAFRLPKVPDELLMTIGTKLADRQQFRGMFCLYFIHLQKNRLKPPLKNRENKDLYDKW